jgi:hypothetical protein
MADFNTHFSKLYPEIKDYVFFGWSIISDLGSREVVGWNCSSSSFVRKESCIERVNKAIKELDIPLVVEDDNEFNKHFKILSRTVGQSYEEEPYTDDSVFVNYKS